jgi:hypothetical protein
MKRTKRLVRRKRIPWRLVALGIGALAVLTTVGVVISTLGTGGKLRQALSMGRLAGIPEFVTDFKFDGTGSRSSAAFFIKFTAAPVDIERFVTGSPGLSTLVPESLGPERMYLPYPASSTHPVVLGQHVFFRPDERYSWFDPTVRGKGRRYVIPKDPNANEGEVTIDDEKLVVYIKVWRS